MFIAHLPAGYLVARKLTPHLARHGVVALLMGAVLPDLDLLWFYLVDGGAVHHHTYVTHRPAVWVAILAGAAACRHPRLAPLSLGAVLHMMLDSLCGAVDWGWPLWQLDGPLVVVPASRSHWVLSVVIHWTFLVEITICATAGWYWRRDRVVRI